MTKITTTLAIGFIAMFILGASVGYWYAMREVSGYVLKAAK